MLAVIAPGQGSQKPGFLLPWLTLPGVVGRLRWWSALTGIDLVHLGTEGDADEIRDTARTQPLLVAAGLLAAERLPMHDVAIVAGHSVGEVTASALSGVLSAESAVALAAARGREMATACALEPTGMSAVLGGDPDEVLARIAACDLYPANRNAATQMVAAGATAGLDKLAADPPAKARVVPLAVAGAFHTPYMEPAERALAVIATGITPAEPTKIHLQNADGTAAGSGADLLQRLVHQVTAPVRWDLCTASLADLGVSAIIELPPAGTLAGLAKRALKGVEIVTVNTPDDLATARDLIARHGTPSDHIAIEPGMQFRVAVAAAAGAFEPADIAEGAHVSSGQVIGQVATRQGGVDVVAADDGVLLEWLAQAADPVASGQPLARFSLQDGGR